MEQNQEYEGAIESQLLFYKSLMRDNVDIEKINHYLEILRASGDSIKLDDPVDDGIRTAFKLVQSSGMDPWAIDVREFVKLYKTKVKANKFDIIVAGKLLVLAWDVVRLQSVATKEESDRNRFDCDFGFDYDLEEFVNQTKPELYIPEIEVGESVPRESTRPATILEILDIFDDVGTMMEEYEESEELRLELKKRKKEAKLEYKMGSEINENDVDKVWERIQKIGIGEFSIRELYTDNIRDNVVTFLAVLHLVYRGELDIRQDDFLNDDIKLSIIVGEADGKTVSAVNQEIEVV